MKKLLLNLACLLLAGFVCGQNDSIRFNSKEYWQHKKYSKEDSMRLNYCRCDSVAPDEIQKLRDYSGDFKGYFLFSGSGRATLYNLNKQVAMCGILIDYKFVYGLKFVYDNEKKLSVIEKYFNQKHIGDCPLHK
jgi:hypothetical protein